MHARLRLLCLWLLLLLLRPLLLDMLLLPGLEGPGSCLGRWCRHSCPLRRLELRPLLVPASLWWLRPRPCEKEVAWAWVPVCSPALLLLTLLWGHSSGGGPCCWNWELPASESEWKL